LPAKTIISTGGSPPPAAPVVGSYQATASVIVLNSSVDVSTPLTPQTRQTFQADPSYATPWPPTTIVSAGLGLESISDELLVIARLKLVFDFGSVLPGDSSQELREAIIATWPGLASSAASLTSGAGAPPYEQAAVTAQVDADGLPNWGYERNVNSGVVLPLSGLSPYGGGRTDFDLFLQNLVRLDLQQRIEQLVA